MPLAPNDEQNKKTCLHDLFNEHFVWFQCSGDPAHYSAAEASSYSLSSSTSILIHSHTPSYQPLPRQFNLSCRLPLLPTPLTHTRHTPVPELDLILYRRERARAVVREVHAGERVGAEVFVAVGGGVLLLVPLGAGAHVLGGGLLLLLAAEPGVRGGRVSECLGADGGGGDGWEICTFVRRIGIELGWRSRRAGGG